MIVWLERLFRRGSQPDQPTPAQVIQEMRAMPTRNVWTGFCASCWAIVELDTLGRCVCGSDEVRDRDFRWVR